MYGDSEAIRGLARTMRDQGTALLDEGAALLARAEGTPWSGLAADAMRVRVRSQCDALGHAAELAGEAAEALDRHAVEVDRRKALIAAVEDHVLGLADELLDRLPLPPSGHRDWLTIDLPGLP